MVIDHIVPESLGGPTEEANLWLACPLCNAHKSDRITVLDANTDEIVRLFNPRQQTWGEHFAWTSEGERIVGRTPIGRATVIDISEPCEHLEHTKIRHVKRPAPGCEDCLKMGGEWVHLRECLTCGH